MNFCKKCDHIPFKGGRPCPAEPVCCKPCWDTCECMDEILKLKESVDDQQTSLNNSTGAITRVERTGQDNFRYLSNTIGDLAENLSQEIQRAATAENQIQNDLNNTKADLADYKQRNDDALQAEIDRATAAEQTLNSVKANSTDVYTKQETYNKTEVDSRIQDVIGTAPAALDTLGEIADKLHDNDDVVTAIINTITTEKLQRETADNNINNTISTIQSTHNNDLQTLTAVVNSEITRATNAENALRTTVSNTSNKNATIGFGENKTIATVNGTNITVGIPSLPSTVGDSVINIGITGNTMVITKGDGTTQTVELPGGYIQIINGLSNAIDALTARVQTLESYWTLSNDNLIAKSGCSVTGAGFYDSTIN